MLRKVIKCVSPCSNRQQLISHVRCAGPVIAYQVPANAVTGSTNAPPEQQLDDGTHTAPETPLLEFSLLSPYLIPPQSLCNRALSLRSPTTRQLVLSYPVCIVDATRYDRNEFIFNFGIVLSNDDTGGRPGLVQAWKRIVRKVASVLRQLEQERQWLSEDEMSMSQGSRQPQDSNVYALCEMIMEDLNCYGECMIPIGRLRPISP